MKILILCNKSPYPAKEGGPIAMNMIIEGLVAARNKVKVLAMNTNKYKVEMASIPDDYLKRTGIEWVEVDLSLSPVKAFLNLFTKRSYHVERFISPSFSAKIKDILLQEQFDVVQFEMPYLSPYLNIVRDYSKARTVLRAHNIEHLIWQRIADGTGNPLKRLYLRHLASTLKWHELTAINQFDGIAAITWKDAEFFIRAGCHVPVTDIPFGIDLAKYPAPHPLPVNFSLFSIGTMNWIPNQEGIRWFLDQVWPMVVARHPTLKYFIAGREMPEWIYGNRYPNVEILGEVEDADKFMQEHTVMIVPLFSGSGIRIKIIEGMANGRPIISTRIGAEGIRYTDGKDILLADSPEQFVSRIGLCMDDPAVCRETGQNARLLIEKEYNRDVIIEKLLGFYRKIGA